ncbi:MAG: response regulator transcription factor [Anaerolineae bacterium]|jgi:DNA-binding response OmpR family regulator|nr:response regulator transcription factor [Anaerolineae bacterium]
MSRNSGAKPAQILYIGREDSSYEKVWQSIEQEGIGVAFARTQTLGLQLARELQPNVVVINPSNSHFSGQRLSIALRHKVPQARRVLLADRGEGKLIECEERLVRPFTGKKLRETLTRVLESLAPHVIKVGPIELDTISRVVRSPQGAGHLTPKQCQLLAIFMQRSNQVISREDLMKEIWDTHYLGDTRTLDVHIRWLREKIEADPMKPSFLLTVRKIGYKLVSSGAPAATSEDVAPALAEG